MNASVYLQYTNVDTDTFALWLLSAGVGRTGVFITLSIVLERMRYEGVVDLFQTVKTLRTQRPAMVQTEVRPAPRWALRLSQLLHSCCALTSSVPRWRLRDYRQSQQQLRSTRWYSRLNKLLDEQVARTKEGHGAN